MSVYNEAVWLTCEQPGCTEGTQADLRHLAHITSGGGWHCHNHAYTDEPSSTRPQGLL